MAITISFDTAAEIAQFAALIGQQATAEFATLVASETILPMQPHPAGEPLAPVTGARDFTQLDRMVGSVELTKPVDGDQPAPTASAPANAKEAVAQAQASAEKAKATRAPKSKAVAAPAPATAPAPAPAAVPEPAEKPAPAANSSPTATAETEQIASGGAGQDFFGGTDKDANARAAEPEEPYSFQEVYDALRAWSMKVDRNTFAALMQACETATVPELEAKPQLFGKIMRHIADHTPS